MGSSVKKVLLTSNGDEISKGIAYHLLKSGCRLVLMGNAKSLEMLAKEITGSLKETSSVKLVELNFEEESEDIFDEAVEEAWKAFGSLDALVNCYAHEGKPQGLLDITENEYKRTVAINFTAPWFLIKAISKRMRDSGSGGSIVFITTILGSQRGLYPGDAAYGSCLAGVNHLALLAAMQLGKYNIRVNSIYRGLHLDDVYPQSVGREKAVKATEEVMPLMRWLDPKKDLGNLVVYLVCDESRYMTGTNIYADGAQSMVKPRFKSYI